MNVVHNPTARFSVAFNIPKVSYDTDSVNVDLAFCAAAPEDAWNKQRAFKTVSKRLVRGRNVVKMSISNIHTSHARLDWAVSDEIVRFVKQMGKRRVTANFVSNLSSHLIKTFGAVVNTTMLDTMDQPPRRWYPDANQILQ